MWQILLAIYPAAIPHHSFVLSKSTSQNIGLAKKFVLVLPAYGKTWTNFMANPIETENARSTLSQPPSQLRHGHVIWPTESKNLLGSPRKDFFAPWKDRHKEKQLIPLFPTFEHSYLRKLWLELWEPSCDYERKAKKIKRSQSKVLTLVNCYKFCNYQPLAFVLYVIYLINKPLLLILLLAIYLGQL